jgi:peptidylprolyl isomerase
MTSKLPVVMFALFLAAAVAAMTTTTATGQAADPATKPAATQPAAGGAEGNRQTTASGLTIVSVAPGDEKVVATSGDTVFVHYTGKLQNGTTFDSSHQRGEPIPFVLGQSQVIKGWDEGIAGMKIGEKRQLIIPPALGYGEKGAGTVIPQNATLTFDVELVGLIRGARLPQQQ